MKEHQYGIVYYVECLGNNCSENYTDESGCRLIQRVIDHNEKEIKSYIFRHAVKKALISPTIDGFMIIGRSYKNDTFKRKDVESLLIARPNLNAHEKSVPLKLFN